MHVLSRHQPTIAERRLRGIRATLAHVPAFAVGAQTRRAVIGAISELDEAIATEVRASEWNAGHPESVDDFAERFALAGVC